MKKFFKIFGIVLVVLIAVMIAVPYLFKDKIFTKVKAEINNNVNAKVDFGDFSLSLFRSFPSLNIRMEKLYVAGIDSFSTDTLVKFKSFDVDVNLMSAFGSEIKINAIVLNEPVFRVVVLKSGKANYDIAKPSVDTVKEAPADTTPVKFKMNLKKFEINKASIVYDDKSMAVFTEIKNLNYKLKGNFADDFTTLVNTLSIESLTAVYEKITYLKKVKVGFDAQIDADMKNMKFTFKDNTFTLNELQLAFEGTVEMPKTDIGVDVKFGLKKTDFKSLLSLIPAIYAKDFQGLETSGKLGFSGYAKGIYNDKNLPAFGAKLVVENGRFKYPALPKSVENVNVLISVENKGGDGMSNEVDISRFHVEVAQNPFDVKMHISTSKADVAIKGNITGKLDFTTISDLVPLPNTTIKGLLSADLVLDGKLSSIEKQKYEEFKAEGKIEMRDFLFQSPDVPKPVNIIETTFLFSPQYLNLASFNMKMGSSDIQMKGKIENYLGYVLKDSLLTGNLDFSSNLLDLNELMTSSETQQPTPQDTTPLNAFEVPKKIDFTLNSSLKKIMFQTLAITDTRGIIVLKDQKVALKNLDMNMLQGSIRLNGSYETKNIARPLVDFGMDISNFDITETAKTFATVGKLAPIAKSCAGKISTTLTFASAFDQHYNPDYKSIEGDGRLKSKSIEVNGSKTFEKISESLKSDKFKKFSINDLDLGFTIKEGVITIEPSKIKMGKGEAQISGKQGLDQTMNYVINLNFPRSEFGGAANQVVDNLFATASNKGVNVTPSQTVNFDVFVEGTVSEPKIRLGLKNSFDNAVSGVKEQVKEEVKEKVKEVKQKASAEAEKIIAEGEKKAQNLISEAEKQAQNVRDAAKKAGDEVIQQADVNGKKLIKEAGSNPLKKLGAEKAAAKMNQEAKDKANKLNSEADAKATGMVNKAKADADLIRQNARKEADKLK